MHALAIERLDPLNFRNMILNPGCQQKLAREAFRPAGERYLEPILMRTRPRHFHLLHLHRVRRNCSRAVRSSSSGGMPSRVRKP